MDRGINYVMKLPEIDPKYFVIFLAWLDAEDLNESAELPELVDRDRLGLEAWKTSARARFQDLISCWMLGEELLSRSFQNVVMDELLALGKIYSEVCDNNIASHDMMPDIDNIYTKVRGRPLGTFLLNLYLSVAKLKLFAESVSVLTQRLGEVLVGDVLYVGIRDLRNRVYITMVPWQDSACRYHIECSCNHGDVKNE